MQFLLDLPIQIKIMLFTALSVVGILLSGGLSLYSSYQSSQLALKLLEVVDETRQNQVLFKIQVQEWKNTLIRGHDEKQYDKYWGRVQEKAETIRVDLPVVKEHMEALDLNPMLIDEFLTSYAVMMDAYAKGIKSYDKDDLTSIAKVDKLVSGVDRAPNTTLDQLVEELGVYAHQQITDANKQALVLMSGMFALVISCLVGAGVAMGRMVTVPVRSMVGELLKLSEYDLKCKVEVNSKDEIGRMSGSFNTFVGKLTDECGCR